jgi:hypothetical protein
MHTSSAHVIRLLHIITYIHTSNPSQNSTHNSATHPNLLVPALLASATGAQCLQDASATWHGVWALELTLLRLAVGLGQLHQDLLRRVPVLLLAGPRLERGRLQCPAVAEG